MTTIDAMLRAICADPHDDVPRIQLADMLEESGDLARASLIRVQLELESRFAELERVRQKIRDGRRGLAAPEKLLRRIEKLKSRELELLEVNWTAWSGVPFATYLANYHNSGAVGVLFRKGFTEAISLPCATWLAHGAELVQTTPLVEVVLTDKRPEKMSGGFRWWWGGASAEGYTNSIPTVLWDSLHDMMAKWPDSPSCYHHLPEADALSALSAACIRWARSAAGLPDLITRKDQPCD